MVAAFSGAVDTAVLFQEQASKAGININVDRVSEDGYWNDIAGNLVCMTEALEVSRSSGIPLCAA